MRTITSAHRRKNETLSFQFQIGKAREQKKKPPNPLQNSSPAPYNQPKARISKLASQLPPSRRRPPGQNLQEEAEEEGTKAKRLSARALHYVVFFHLSAAASAGK